jgi:hypothetical protein
MPLPVQARPKDHPFLIEKIPHWFEDQYIYVPDAWTAEQAFQQPVESYKIQTYLAQPPRSRKR